MIPAGSQEGGPLLYALARLEGDNCRLWSQCYFPNSLQEGPSRSKVGVPGDRNEASACRSQDGPQRRHTNKGEREQSMMGDKK